MINKLNDLQNILYGLTAFVHSNADKIDFLPKGIELDTVCFSGSLTFFKFTLESCLHAQGERFIETQKVFDWAEYNGFNFDNGQCDHDWEHFDGYKQCTYPDCQVKRVD